MELILNILLVALVFLLLFSLWKAIGILDQLNSTIENTINGIDEIKQTLDEIKKSTASASGKIEVLQQGVDDFSEELGPFFSGGRELIDDILRNKRESTKNL